MILINSITRQFNVPGSDLVFGVVADSDAERKHFQCPRYVGDGLDLASCFIRINYRNANGKEDFYLVDDMVIDGDNITFSWLLSPKVTEYRGQVKFVLCAVGPDLKLKWHTTQGTGQVMDGLEPDNSHVESQTADVVAQLISMVEAQTSAVEKVGADQVAAVKASAKTAQDNAVAEIEAKRTNSLESIPDDYTALSATVDAHVREAAPGIVCHAEGEVITLNDASDNVFRGMRIFGKSTQDGTPTPENPVEIVSVGDAGSVSVKVSGKNLLPNEVYSQTINGLAVASNADKSITINGTAEKQTTIIVKAGRGWINGGSYVGTGCPSGGGASKYYIRFSDDIKSYDDYGGGVAVSFAENSHCYAQITIMAGVTASNLTFRPMLRYAHTLDSTYVPYQEVRTIAIAVHLSLHGIPVTSGGNYTDASGQQRVADYVDAGAGEYVQYIGVIESYAGEEITSSFMSTTGELTDGAKILYVLATPIKTTLSESELAAYRALHTNKPNTTIFNNSGAYMSVDYTADTKLYIDNKIKEALL